MGLILLTVGCCAMGFAGFSILRPSPPVVIVNPPVDPALLSHGDEGESNVHVVPPGEENPGDEWE